MGRFGKSAVASIFVVLAAVVGGEALVDRVDRGQNRVFPGDPEPVSEADLELHNSFPVVDLHADPLLWSRDLLKRGSYGHVDVPRMLEGGMALQVFGVVTKSPKGQNFERNDDTTDRLTALFIARRAPTYAWFSLYGRARYQARNLWRFAEKSEGQLLPIRTQADLDDLLARRRAGEQVVGAMLGLEGAHAIEGDFAKLEGLAEEGFRMVGLNHFFDNEVSGSAHGIEQGGLTELGRRVVDESPRLGITIDLAHASPQARREVLARSTRPVVVSHTGVRGTCEGPRNLTDEDLRALAQNGGIAAIAFFKGATCGEDLDAILDAILYTIEIVGIDHVALGSDFDGAVATPFDIAGMAQITTGLRRRGLGDEEIGKVLGGNALRIFRENLPD